ncbi:MAG: hypothetical protein AAF541_18750 [Pseudomonadota bacterium]
MTSFLEYNDWLMRISDNSGQSIYEQIAAASSATGALTFGEDAWRHARTHPQQFNARYLSSLNAEPVKGDLAPAKNLADLVYHQFNTLPQALERLVVAIPSHFSDEQLGLLMGIVSQTPNNICGFVDLALAQALHHDIAEDCVLVDFELTRSLLTTLNVTDDQLRVTDCKTVDGTGIIQVIDGWMNLIADEFVKRTRFDPMHAGACEQQIQQQISTCLRQGGTLARVSVEHNDVNREVDIDTRALQEKLSQRLAPLLHALKEIVSSDTRLLLSNNAASIPGLTQLLDQAALTYDVLSAGVPAAGLAQLSQAMPADEVVRLTSATLENKVRRPSPDQAAEAPAPLATHLLHDHTALPVSDSRFSDHFQHAPACVVGQAVEIQGLTYLGIRVI